VYNNIGLELCIGNLKFGEMEFGEMKRNMSNWSNRAPKSRVFTLPVKELEAIFE